MLIKLIAIAVAGIAPLEAANAHPQILLEWLPQEKRAPKKFPVIAIHRLGYKTFELMNAGATVCGAVEQTDRGKMYVTQDSVYDRAYFEVTDEARRIDLGDGQACFEGYVRHKEGKSKEEAALEGPNPTDGMPFRYWLTK